MEKIISKLNHVVIILIALSLLIGKSTATAQAITTDPNKESKQYDFKSYINKKTSESFIGIEVPSVDLQLKNPNNNSVYLFPVGEASSSTASASDSVDQFKDPFEEYWKSLEKQQKMQNAQEEVFRQSVLSKKNVDVFKETITRFPSEKIKFSIAQFLVQYHQLWLDTNGDPRRMSTFFETLADPISDIGFYFFMLGNGYTMDQLQKIGVRNLDIKNKQILFKSLVYIGTSPNLRMNVGASVGLLASQVFHDVSETFRSCALGRMKFRTDERLDQRVAERKNIDSICKESLRTWKSEQVAKRYLPSIVGLAIGNLVVHESMKGFGAIGKFAVDKAALIKGLDLTFVMNAGKVVITRCNFVVSIVSLAYFLGIDPFISPYITRAYGILSDSLGNQWDNWHGYTLENKAQKCVDLSSKYKNSSALNILLKECYNNLGKSILDWRDLHNSWRINVNSDYEMGRHSYMTTIQKTLNQYTNSQSYYMSLIQRRFNDAYDFAKLNARIISPENAHKVQDHINRKYPLFGVYVDGLTIGKPFAPRSELQNETNRLYYADSTEFENIQMKRLSLISKVFLYGFDSLSNQESLIFFMQNFGLYEDLILKKLISTSTKWIQDNNFSDSVKGLTPDDQYQWVKENILENKEKVPLTRSFFNSVVAPSLLNSSIFWKTGLVPLLSQKGNLTQKEQIAISTLQNKFSTTDINKLAEALLYVNDLMRIGSDGQRMIVDGNINNFVYMIRQIIGDPKPILVEGMAFPYIYRSSFKEAENMKNQNYHIPTKYPYIFRSAADYLNHEMLCGEEKAQITLRSGYDAVFSPPRLVTNNSDFKYKFCRPSMGSSPIEYSTLYTKKLNLFGDSTLVGVIPTILNNLNSTLAPVDTAKIVSGKDTTERGNLYSEELKKITNWWEEKSTNEYLSFLNQLDKRWNEVYKKFQENILRDSNQTKKIGFSSWSNFWSPIVEKARVGDKLPYNVGNDLILEWDEYMRLIKALDADKSMSPLIANVENEFKNVTYYFFDLATIDMSTKDRKFKSQINKSIFDQLMALNRSINNLKNEFDKKYPDLKENLDSGLSNVTMALGNYMNSAVLAIYDPETETHKAAELLKSNSGAEASRLKQIKGATQGHTPF